MRRERKRQESERRFITRQERLRAKRQRRNSDSSSDLSAMRADGGPGGCAQGDAGRAVAGLFSAGK